MNTNSRKTFLKILNFLSHPVTCGACAVVLYLSFGFTRPWFVGMGAMTCIYLFLAWVGAKLVEAPKKSTNSSTEDASQ